jgi:hypothetical protein
LIGCVRSEPATAQLTAELSPKFAIASAQEDVGATLLVKNVGSVAIELRHIDGGCGCRNVDNDGLPITLAPHGARSFRMNVTPRGTDAPQRAGIAIDTDHGLFSAFVDYQYLRRVSFEPDSIVLGTFAEGNQP